MLSYQLENIPKSLIFLDVIINKVNHYRHSSLTYIQQ